MIFRTFKTNSFEIKKTKMITLTETFEDAFVYICRCCGVQQAYKINDFHNVFEKDISIQAFEVKLPTEFSFVNSGGTLIAKAVYDNFTFCIQIDNLKKFALVDLPKDCTYYEKGQLMFLTKKGARYCKDWLKSMSSILVSAEAYEKESENTVETSAKWILEFWVSFLIDWPGCTDGPDEGASPKEIKEYLKNQK